MQNLTGEKVKREMWAKTFALKRTKYCYFIGSRGCLSVTTGSHTEALLSDGPSMIVMCDLQ